MDTRIVLRLTGSIIQGCHVRFSRIINDVGGKVRSFDVVTGLYDIEVRITDRNVVCGFVDDISKLSRYCSVIIKAYTSISGSNALLKMLKKKNVRYVKANNRIRFATLINNTLLLHEYNARSGVLISYVITNVCDINVAPIIAVSDFSSYIASSTIKCNSTLVNGAVQKLVTGIKELLMC
ncbi:MAG: hypothetical protein J7J20_04015 [Desulfurococcales archaeon]|nr:hypothetical protein [Desulfurococcales archaeon]